MEVGSASDFFQGGVQGLLDPIEGLIQLVEKSGNWEIAPKGLRDWARNYRKQARSTMAGIGGEVAGNIAPSVLIPGGAAGTAASWGERALTAGLSGGIAGGLQPVSGGSDYWKTKRDQAALGAVAGVVAPSLASGAGGVLRGIGSIPSGVMHLLHRHSPAVPLAHLATQAASRLRPGAAGAVAGQYRGENPFPGGQLAPSKPADDDTPPRATPPPADVRTAPPSRAPTSAPRPIHYGWPKAKDEEDEE
jgi:hypothetical protein